MTTQASLAPNHRWYGSALALLLGGLTLLLGYQWQVSKAHNDTPQHWSSHIQPLPVAKLAYVAVDMGSSVQKNQQFQAFQQALSDMRKARTQQIQAVAKLNGKPQNTAVKKTPAAPVREEQSTMDLILKIARVLIIEEVTGLVQKAELAVEVGQHVADKVQDE